LNVFLADQPVTFTGKDTPPMHDDSLNNLKKPETFVDDPITEILRQGARKLLNQALEAEVEFFLSQYAELKDNAGRQRIVRNGYLPEREIQSGCTIGMLTGGNVADVVTTGSVILENSIDPASVHQTESGHNPAEWMVTMFRNKWSQWSGMRGQFAAE